MRLYAEWERILGTVSAIRQNTAVSRRMNSLWLRMVHGVSVCMPAGHGGGASVSMKRQLTWLLAGLSIAPILVMGIMTFSQAQSAVHRAQESMLRAHVQGIRHSMESVLAGVDNTSKGIASQTNVQILMEDVNRDGVVNDTSMLSSTAFSLKNAVKGSGKLYESAFVTGKSGTVLVEGTLGKTDMVGRSIAGRDYYRKSIESKRVTVGAPYRSEASGRWVIPVGRSIENLAGRSGTLVILFDHQRFMEFLSSAEIGKTGAVYVLDRAGNAVYSPNSKETMVPLKNGLFKVLIRGTGKGSDQGFGDYSDPAGHRLAAWESLVNTDWTVVATLSRGEFEAGILRIRSSMLGVVLVTALAAYFAAVRYAEWATGPIKAMGVLMSRVAGGDLQCESVHRPNREMAELSDSFNRMLANLKGLISEIASASDSVAE